MNKLRSYFQQPYPATGKPWVIVIVSSLLVFFLLGLFQPFGLEHFPNPRKWLTILGFASVTALSTAMVGYVFPWVFKRFYDPENWTQGKNLINHFIILLTISLGNFLFDCIFIPRSPETLFSLLTAYLVITCLIGIIPAIVSSFIIQNKNLKQNLSEVRELNKRLSEKLQTKNSTSDIQKEELLILSGNTRNEIKLIPGDILYMEASGNYVVFHYKTENKEVRQEQLRTTIAQTEETLKPFPFFVRCHRAFIVNTSYIQHIEGNSQGYMLSLQYTAHQIPVSRTYAKSFRKKL